MSQYRDRSNDLNRRADIRRLRYVYSNITSAISKYVPNKQVVRWLLIKLLSFLAPFRAGDNSRSHDIVVYLYLKEINTG